MICEASSFSEGLFSGAKIIRKLREPLSDVKTMIAEPIQNVYDQINTTVIGIFAVIIIFIIIYCILIEVLLGFFCCSKKIKCLGCCLKWILCFIYYTSIFIIIIGFIIGIVVGVIGSLVKDMTQVLVYIIPVYKNESVLLIKSTSIASYISIMELTKASDIVRNRTYEAFFPLIFVAIIYFLICYIFCKLLDYINKKVNPRMVKTR